MQPSSLFLSAAALLAQAVSADFRLLSDVATMEGPARIEPNHFPGHEDNPLPQPVKFTSDPSFQIAEISLDSEGDIGSKFLLQKLEPNKWALVSRKNGSVPITVLLFSPFRQVPVSLVSLILS